MAMLVALKFLYTTETNIMIDAYTGMMEQVKAGMNSASPEKPIEFDTRLALSLIHI